MELIITLRRPVPDTVTAQQIVDIVKVKLEDHPEVMITSQVTDFIEPTS